MSELEVFKQADWVAPQNRFVFWSGGKDSTVALHLALRAWKNPKVVFIESELTLPETLDFIEEIEKLWSFSLLRIKVDFDFWAYVAKYGFPYVHSLWCRRLLKYEPIKDFYRKVHGWKVQVLGIRKAEGVHRAKSQYYQKDFWRDDRFRFCYTLLPLLDWSNAKIKRYNNEHKIPVNPCYKYYKTSGCYYCPFIRNQKHYLSLKHRHPRLFQKIVDAEDIMRKGKSSLFSTNQIFVKDLAEQQFLEVA